MSMTFERNCINITCKSRAFTIRFTVLTNKRIYISVKNKNNINSDGNNDDDDDGNSNSSGGGKTKSNTNNDKVINHTKYTWSDGNIALKRSCLNSIVSSHSHKNGFRSKQASERVQLVREYEYECGASTKLDD